MNKTDAWQILFIVLLGLNFFFILSNPNNIMSWIAVIVSAWGIYDTAKKQIKDANVLEGETNE